jgi:AraC-like DNA-binding protein
MLAVFAKWPEISGFGKIAGTECGMLGAVISDLDLGLRSAGVAISLVLMLAVAVRSGWRRRADLLAVVACSAAYVICSAPARPCCGTASTLPLLLAAIAFPFAFWRLARVVLEDDSSIPRAAWVGLAMLLVSGMIAAADYLVLANPWRMAGAVANKLAALAFIAGALLALWRSWQGDLVEGRRRLRWLLIGYLGIYGLAVMVGEVYLLGDRPPPGVDLLNVAMIDLTLLVTCVYLVAPNAQALETLFASPASPASLGELPAVPAPAEEAKSSDEPQLARLRGFMENEKVYRDPDLTVGALATRVGVPEYALRRLIHDHLGHRNFAGFVNEYRLQEVRERLRDPSLARRPVLTLALEAGFGSIGPFNRLFKERFGMTPTAFRVQADAAQQQQGPAAVI